MTIIGLDGCKAGWIGIILDADSALHLQLFSRIDLVFKHFPDVHRILIDIPIGLVDRGKKSRLCDVLARKALGWPRSSSIFTPPCRKALYASSYQKANEINKKNTTKGLSKQAWYITPKIAEVDSLLNRNLLYNQILWESHPEVCFWSLNGGHSMQENKHKPEGFHERWEIIQKWTKKLEFDYDLDAFLHLYPRSQVQRDDILDAWILALTGSEKIGPITSFPPNPSFDGNNLPQRIVYSIIQD